MNGFFLFMDAGESMLKKSPAFHREGGGVYVCVYQPLMAATPGSTLPSMASRSAPPPVEM